MLLGALFAWSAPLAAQTEPPTGTLPPVEGQTPAEPQPPPAEPQPPPAAPEPPPAQPAPQPQPQPPPYPYAYPPPAYAYPPPAAPAPAPEPPPTRSVSITMSPVHLFFPVLELMAELRAVDGFGIAVIGGYGQVSAEDSFGDEHDFNVLEVGGQLAWYPLEPFSSLVVGGEVLYVEVETEEETDEATVTGVGNGVAIGPFVGYKLLTRGGFTFLVHGGIQYVALRAEASANTGESESDEDSRVIPLLNLNLGWSF